MSDCRVIWFPYEPSFNTPGGGGEVNTASNVGTGKELFKVKTGVDLAFRSLVAGTNISLVQNADDIVINATGGIANGTGVNNTLYWDGSNWTENSNFRNYGVSGVRITGVTSTSLQITQTSGADPLIISAGATTRYASFIDNTSGNTEWNVSKGGNTYQVGDAVIDNNHGLILGELDVNGSEYVKIQSASAMVSSYTIRLPNAQGGVDTYLKNDGSGNLSWATVGSGGEVNTASNLGAGSQIFASKVGVDLQFKSIVAGTGISLSSTTDEITINSTSPIMPNFGTNGNTIRDNGTAWVSNNFFRNYGSYIGINAIGASSRAVTIGDAGVPIVALSVNGIDTPFEAIATGSFVSGASVVYAHATDANFTGTFFKAGRTTGMVFSIGTNGQITSIPLKTSTAHAGSYLGLYVDTATGTIYANTDVPTAGGEVNTASNLGAGSQIFASKVGVDLQLRSLVAGTNISLTQNANDITINATGVGETNTASNLGAGSQIFASKVGVDLQLRSLVAGTNISLTQNANDITINATGVGESNTASNLGAGSQIFASKVGVDLQLRSLVAGTNISLTQNANDITINATAGGLSYWTESEFTYGGKTGTKFTPSSANTNQSVVLQPKGTGAILAQQPDGTATGGNVRGSYAVDLQLNRSSADQVANGYASVTLGQYNKATGMTSVAIGQEGVATGTRSVTIGYRSEATGDYSIALGYLNKAYGDFSIIPGGSQNEISYTSYSGIGSGQTNTINGIGSWAFIGGGKSNIINASGNYNFVGGGLSSTVQGTGAYSFIGGGGSNGITDATYSSILGSYGNQILTGVDYATIIGTNCRISGGGTYGIALGQNTQLNRYGEIKWQVGNLVNDGDSGLSSVQLKGITTEDTAVELFLGGVSGKRLTIPANSTCLVKYHWVRRRISNNSVTSSGEQFVIVNKDATDLSTTIITTYGDTARYGNDAGFTPGSDDLTVTADITNGSLKFEATGQPLEEIRWFVFAQVMEILE